VTQGLEDFNRAVREGRIKDFKTQVYTEGDTVHVELLYLVDPEDQYVTINVVKAEENEAVMEKRPEGEYTMKANCSNCGFAGTVTYRKGEPSAVTSCPRCENITFNAQRSRW
jgi:hypothetical protein